MRTFSVNINGTEYPITDRISDLKYGTLPVIDLNLASDLEWDKLALESRLKHPEIYSYIDQDYDHTVEKLQSSIHKLLGGGGK